MPLFEVRVRGGVVRCVGGAVPEEVDGDDRATGVGEQVDPARRAPAVLERRREPVDEDERVRFATSRSAAVNSRHDNGGSPSCWRTNSSRNQIQNARTSSGGVERQQVAVAAVRVDLDEQRPDVDRVGLDPVRNLQFEVDELRTALERPSRRLGRLRD